MVYSYGIWSVRSKIWCIVNNNDYDNKGFKEKIKKNDYDNIKFLKVLILMIIWWCNIVIYVEYCIL